MKNNVVDDSSPRSEPPTQDLIPPPSVPVANLEQERTVISQKPVAAPVDFMRSLSLVELARQLEGRQLHHFAVDRMIGGGGMGAVFHGRDLRLDREVAIKVIPESKRDPETLRRFRMEAQSAAKLDHPNIARVYDIGEDETWNYIVFEFIDGINLRDLVLTEGPLSIDDAVYTTRQVAEALQHAHERDVVHRDIKPSNVIITPTGIAKVVDMGLARDTAMERSTADQTASGVTLGTFDYISPEQARDPRDADVRSDLYSLGCTMFFMLTGQPPFPDGTALQKLLNHGSQPHPDPRRWRDDISDELAAVLSKLMAKRPTDRYQKPNELINDLLMIAQLESLPRARSAGAIVLRPSITKRSLLEQHLPWLVPLSVVLATAFWLQSSDSFSAPFELPLPSFQPAPPISAALRTPDPATPESPALTNASNLPNPTITGSTVGSNPGNTAVSNAGNNAGNTNNSTTAIAAGLPNGQPANAGPSTTASPPPNFSPTAQSTNGNSTSGSNTALPHDMLPKQPTLFPANQETGKLAGDTDVGELVMPTATPGTNSISTLGADALSTSGNRTTFPEGEFDSARVDSARVDSARVDSARVDSARVDAARVDAARVEAAHAEIAKINGGVESARNENAIQDVAKADLNRTDLTSSEAWPDTNSELPRDASRTATREPARPSTSREATPEVSREVVRNTIIVRRTQPAMLQDNQLWAPTLAAALSQASSLTEVQFVELSESIELQEAIVIPRGDLTLRAANGQTVEIALSGLYAIGMGWESWINIGENSLHCEGLRILCCNDMRQPQAVFALEPGGRLSLQDCTVTVESSLETVPGACLLIKDKDRNAARGGATESGLLRQSDRDMGLTSISIKNSVVRGYQSLINMRVATRAEIAIEKVCAMLEGRVLAVRGVESSQMPPVVRMSLNQSTLICQQGFALLQGGSGALPPVTLMRSSKLCAYWSPAAVPHIVVEGVDTREQLRDLMQLRGEENAYDQNIGTLCQARMTDGSHIDYSFREAAGEWFVERYNDSSLRWQANVPPDRPLEEQTADDYRLRAGMFIPGYPPNLVIKN